MTRPVRTRTVLHAIARVIADAIEGHVFATSSVADVGGPTPGVMPVADDFTEAGMPAVLVGLGPWDSRRQPGNERMHYDVLCSVWRPRVELGQELDLLYGDRDAIADAFIAHTKAYDSTGLIEDAVLMDGPGIVPRETPRGSVRDFLTLPFTVQVICNRYIDLQPA
jgi:hypothetical protein